MCATKRPEMAARTTRISVGLPPRVGLAQAPEPRQEVAEAEENSGMEGRDKHGEQQRQRIDLQQDTQAVVRSGCFLLHSDSAAPSRCRDLQSTSWNIRAFLRGWVYFAGSICPCARARCAEAHLEALIIPSRGFFISRIRKIAPARDSAQTNIIEITVRLRGANRP